MIARNARTWLAALLGCIAACGPSQIDVKAPSAPPKGAAEKFGAGYVSKVPPQGVVIARNKANKPVSPKVTDDFKGPPKSNTWWSSLIWQFEENNPYSLNMYAHPLVLRAKEAGLGVSYPSEPVIKPREYMHRYAEDLTLGLEGQKFPDARCAGYSDFAVTAAWKNGDSELRATFGHGLPFVYATRTGSARALVSLASGKSAEVVKDEGNALLIKLAGRHYGLFGPTKSKWEKTDAGYASSLDGKDYFSVAVLPDGADGTWDMFRTRSFAFVTDTQVSWSYDDAKAVLSTTFKVATEAKESGKGIINEPVLALYRHHYLNTKAELSELSYASPRGKMRVLAESEFTMQAPFTGVLPALPNAAGLTSGDVSGPLTEAYGADDLFPRGYGPGPERDAYWAGKSLGRNATTLYIAEQLGHKDAQDRLIAALKNELADWFDGQAPRNLYYEKRWHSLVALPASYGSAEELNDHHFHYGYFIAGAAAVARFDPAWAKKYEPIIEQLVRDAANWTRGQERFPFLRHMDVFAGHSWANGPAQFDDGNNEESTSEDILLSSSLILWGSTIGNKEIRDLGIFLFTHQVLAAEQYWFDVDNEVFPESFDHTVIAMVWGAGAKYDTWFDADPIMVHGINYLPFTGGSTYLGRHPEYVKKNFGEVFKRSDGAIYSWRDYMLMYLSMADPKRALEMYEQDTHFNVEFGNTKLNLIHWLKNMNALGQVDTTVTCDVPTYAVFKGPKGKTYSVFNGAKDERTVTCSDGTSLKVGGRKQVMKVKK